MPGNSSHDRHTTESRRSQRNRQRRNSRQTWNRTTRRHRSQASQKIHQPDDSPALRQERPGATRSPRTARPPAAGNPHRHAAGTTNWDRPDAPPSTGESLANWGGIRTARHNTQQAPGERLAEQHHPVHSPEGGLPSGPETSLERSLPGVCGGNRPTVARREIPPVTTPCEVSSKGFGRACSSFKILAIFWGQSQSLGRVAANWPLSLFQFYTQGFVIV